MISDEQSVDAEHAEIDDLMKRVRVLDMIDVRAGLGDLQKAFQVVGLGEYVKLCEKLSEIVERRLDELEAESR